MAFYFYEWFFYLISISIFLTPSLPLFLVSMYSAEQCSQTAGWHVFLRGSLDAPCGPLVSGLCCRVVSALLHVLPEGSWRSMESIDIRLTWNKWSWKIWHRTHVIAGNGRLANKPQSLEVRPALAMFPCLPLPMTELPHFHKKDCRMHFVQKVPW